MCKEFVGYRIMNADSVCKSMVSVFKENLLPFVRDVDMTKWCNKNVATFEIRFDNGYDASARICFAEELPCDMESKIQIHVSNGINSRDYAFDKMCEMNEQLNITRLLPGGRCHESKANKNQMRYDKIAFGNGQLLLLNSLR